MPMMMMMMMMMMMLEYTTLYFLLYFNTAGWVTEGHPKKWTSNTQRFCGRPSGTRSNLEWSPEKYAG